MKKLAPTSLMASLMLGSISLLGAACVSYEVGVVHAEISLSNAGPGALGACEPDNDAIRVTLEDDAGDTQVELFNCDETLAATTVQPGGDYTLWLDYVHDNFTPDPTDDSVVGTTGSVDITIDGDVDVAADILMDHGFFSASFFLEDMAGFPLECADVPGENGVGILATLSGTADGFDTFVNCEDAVAFTQAVPVGEHVIELSLVDGADLALGASDPITASVDNGNEYVDIGDVTIVVFD